MKADGQFLETRADAAACLEAAHALLDHVPLTVGLRLERDRRVVAGFFVFLVGDDRFDPLLSEPVAKTLFAVPFVAGQLFGLAASSVLARRDEGGDQRFQPRRL